MKTMNPKKTARIAGLLYLIMAPFAVFGVMYGNSLIESGDAATTATNILASGSLFALSIVSALIVQIGHIILVTLLYKLLKPVNKTYALLMLIFLLVSIPIAMFSELNRFAILILLNGTNYLTAFTTGQLQALVLLFNDIYKLGISFAWIFWGLWLFPMGYLVFKSGFLPKFLGILLIIACFGYLIDFVTYIFLPSFGQISIYTSVGEFPILALWLLIKGVKVEQWEKRALESA